MFKLTKGNIWPSCTIVYKGSRVAISPRSQVLEADSDEGYLAAPRKNEIR